jgi:glycosyltransferase involved in cell wall biosynthesis
MIEPYFSIIIPTFNRPEMLRRAIASVLSQTYEDWEIVIVDDGGDQAVSAAMMEGFRDQRIRYFWKSNEERSIARNFGCQQARGRYVVFMDSDDRILPEHLAAIHDSISVNGEKEFFHTTFLIEHTQDGTQRRSRIVPPEKIANRIIYESVFAIGASAIRRDIACLHPFPEMKEAAHGEDWFFYIRIFLRYGVTWVDSESFVYSIGPQSSVRNIDPERFRRSFDAILDLIEKDDVLRSVYGPLKFQTLVGYKHLGIALQYLIAKNGNPITASKYILSGASVAPWLVTSRRFVACGKLLLKRLLSFR